jgi:hypothetical protein
MFIIYGWILPSLLLTTHTFLTIICICTTPVGGRVPLIIGISYLLFVYGPFEMKIHRQPTKVDIFAVLSAGLIPLVSIILFIGYVFEVAILILVNIDIFIEDRNVKKFKR